MAVVAHERDVRDEGRRRHADDGRAHEVTIVETHTPDAPFIFESSLLLLVSCVKLGPLRR